MSYCNSCYKPYYQCSCNYTCSGCPVQLDFSCIIYNKSNNETSELDGLGLSNGATLKLVIETLDEKVKQLKVLDFDLPCLREQYVINTFQQFAEAVDTELCELADATFPYLGQFESGDAPEDPQEGQYWTNEDEVDILYMYLNGAIREIALTALV